MQDEIDPTGAIAAIAFALENDEGLAFLRCWNEGDFDAIRREWPEAPPAVFVGAEPALPAEPSSACGVGSSPLAPSAALLSKLGSILVHLDELESPHGHPFDREVAVVLRGDAEVRAWLQAMDELSLLPKKRNS